ncbi:hypothetical protein QYE76_002186 [Lolium multiflorum]|uniref:AP2/ERF domain-containing protein n=1 Tax=Lolium multiflorum TaxID=4521 RepID=A0AAD8W0D9_LOLMU|nr:hypothetical protein QYE76_002186 [Lolium multiflorum]
MPPRRRGASGFRGVRVRPSGRFTAEIRAGGFRLTLGTYNTPEEAARAYDAVAWRFRRPGHDMNFPDVESLEEAEFLAPPPCLVDDEDRRRHRQVQRRIAIAERDEQLMRQVLFLHVQKTEEITKWGHEAWGLGGAAQAPAAPACPPALVWPLALTFRLLKVSVVAKPQCREPRYGKPSRDAAAVNPISGIQRSPPHPAERIHLGGLYTAMVASE